MTIEHEYWSILPPPKIYTLPPPSKKFWLRPCYRAGLSGILAEFYVAAAVGDNKKKEDGW